jgi:biopolymer transport protein ExbD
MKYRCRADAEVPFPLAPMIDLTFLLLIFFMVTSRISQESVQETIRLPVASAGWIPADASHRDVIDVREGGRVSIAQKTMNRAELGNYLQSRLQNLPHRKIYLRADASTPARTIKEMITIATEAGASQMVMGVHQQ